MRYQPTLSPSSVAVVPGPPPAAQAPVPGGIKRLNFGAIAKKETGKTLPHNPVLPDPEGEYKALADRIIELSEAEKQLKAAKALLIEAATPFWFHTCSGRSDVPSSVLVQGAEGQVSCTFQNKYKATDPDALAAALNGRLDQFFRQSFSLEIDGDKIPADKAQALIADLQALFGQHDCLEALSVSDRFVPKDEFHTQRHMDFTVEQNLALNAVCGIVAQVRRK